jgi:hypothetical protein
MNPSFQRAPLSPPTDTDVPAGQDPGTEAGYDPAFEAIDWSASEEAQDAGAGGRTVLAVALAGLAALWIGFTAWSAGRTFGGAPASAAALAQWLAIAAGPLALLGLLWLIFGRTRRREAERFTRSVVAMRSEARSLEALLGVLTQRIDDSHNALASVTERLMRLGDEATGRLDGVTRELDASSERLTRNGEALDRAAQAARSDIGVILTDLPEAEARALAAAEQLRAIGSEAVTRAAAFGEQVTALSAATREADEQVGASAQRLVAHLTHIESAGAAAAARVSDAEASFSTALGSLLERTAVTLDQIRGGIDTQSAAVAALVDQASAGIGRAGIEAADALGGSIGRAGASLDALSSRVAEQERLSQSLFAEVDRGLSLIDQRFAELAAQGDERANHFLGSLTRARAELDALAEQAGSQDASIEALASRTSGLRDGIDRLATEIREGLAGALADAEGGAERVRDVATLARPEVAWIRDAAVEASERIAESGTTIEGQQDRLTALLATLDEGVGTAEARLSELSGALNQAQGEAARLTAETGPALVAALVQVRDAAAHAASRAREAIEGVIPDSAGKLGSATREALEAAIREGIEERLRGVEGIAAQAVEQARAASDRLTQQMLSLGQSASALDQHFQQRDSEQREKDSEAFARRVALLIDSMHSASIDVGKILSDEIDDKAWGAYLKGDRSVFTRRAVQLLDGSEERAIRAHYDADGEFQASVNRYVHDFEAMLRRVLAERDGGMIAVTLMSSDMGKLYAALAQAVDRRR